MVIGVEVPPERNRFALEGDKQAIGNAEQDVEDHDPANDPDMHAVNSDTQKEEANTDLEGSGRKGVGDFAKEPVLLVASVSTSVD